MNNKPVPNKKKKGGGNTGPLFVSPYASGAFLQSPSVALEMFTLSETAERQMNQLAKSLNTKGTVPMSNDAEEPELTEPKLKSTVVEFDSVIMSEEKRQQILEALEQINQHDLIFDTWGFGETIEKGRGASLLFYGPPGTGKTLVAQAIANKMGYKLKVIMTADIQSSVPGESERNIRKHFKNAKDGKTILLFDECDSLLYNRHHLGPILGAQINELLSQIERFDGLTIFTTNRLGILDEALNRRLALKLAFELPTFDERINIWKRMFPKKAPVARNVDWAKLATVEIAGGHIKNTVMRAARMAAIEKVDDDKKKIKMGHLVKALTLEAHALMEFEKAGQETSRGIGYISPTPTIHKIVDNGVMSS